MAAVLLAACGGSTEAERQGTATAPAQDTASHGDGHTEDEHEAESGQTVVHTLLDEWTITLGHEGEEKELTVPARPVTFEIHNEGQSVHELAVIRTELPADDLPQKGGAVDEAAAGELLGRTEYLASGAADVLTLDLEPGRYVLICNIPGHYQQGM